MVMNPFHGYELVVMNLLVCVRPMVAVNKYEPLVGCAPYGGYELDVTDTQDSDGRTPKEYPVLVMNPLMVMSPLVDWL